MPISKEDFRAALGRFASGITVVTSVDKQGRAHGMTVSAFCSVSLDPPLILVTISKDTGSHYSIAESGKFVVNILREDQEHVSELFAAPVPDRFSEARYIESQHGVPVIEGALANLECDLRYSHEGGDHTIYVGEITDAHMSDDGAPLIHFRGGYQKLSE
jgi:flavin reductase (DIM6/NTAB) family NADH-FMN oxidoreductase RutF